MAFKLYTNTKFRIYHNLGGRFIPQFKNGSSWESFKELGVTVNRARQGNAEKFIQRKADRLFYGKAHIEFVEAERPQQEEQAAPQPSEWSPVRNFSDLSPEDQIASLTRLINNPYFPEEEREKLLQQRTQLEAACTASKERDKELLYADFVIPDGKPFLIKPYVQRERQIPGKRNALRLEFFSPIDRCSLLPLDDKARWLHDHRPDHLHFQWDQFSFCCGTECKTCLVAERNLRTFDILTYSIEAGIEA